MIFAAFDLKAFVAGVTPGQWALLAVAGVLVALYLYKRKQQPPAVARSQTMTSNLPMQPVRTVRPMSLGDMLDAEIAAKEAEEEAARRQAKRRERQRGHLRQLAGLDAPADAPKPPA